MPVKLDQIEATLRVLAYESERSFWIRSFHHDLLVLLYRKGKRKKKKKIICMHLKNKSKQEIILVEFWNLQNLNYPGDFIDDKT